MRKLLIGAFLTLMVSFYFFHITFPFLPREALNTKNLMAGFGTLALIYDGIRNESMMLSRYTLIAGLLAAIFSVWCLYAVTDAGTYELGYATYIFTVYIWLAGAYGVCFLLRGAYGKVDLALLTKYLAIVGVVQCLMAVAIDNSSVVERLVDRIMYQPGDYYKVHNRMYGLGAALDPAGIRFSTILIMISHDFSHNPKVRDNRLFQATDLIAFAIILIIGAVISRTTLVGAAMGIGYIGITLLRMRRGGFVTISMVQSFFWFFAVVAGIIFFAVYFYIHSETFQQYLRFGFEAFFNWIETGDFSTGSTDILETMWIWPTDAHTWLVGQGTYGIIVNHTDIGYCNFILFSGLVGMVLYSIFFLYCHFAIVNKFQDFQLTAWLLVALTFIVWIKVTTDIFFIDALLFCIAGDYDHQGEVDEETEEEEEEEEDFVKKPVYLP